MKVSSNTSDWHKNIFTVLKYCALLALVRIGAGQACPVENEDIEIIVDGHTLTAEVAANLTSQLCGLAFRHDLPPNRGMLFAYAQDQIVGFWMKNTYLPLSIAFMDADGNILEIHNMDPRDPTRHYISSSPVRYALEVKQGWFKDNRIEVGDRAEFDLRGPPEVFRYTPEQ